MAFVSDSKAAFGEFSADKAVQKNVPLLGQYAVMCAGTDASRAPTILNRVRRTFKGREPQVPIDDLADTLHFECKAERDRITEAKVLNKHGYDSQTFRDRGKQLCTSAVFFDIHAAMAQVSLSLNFLIAGFDQEGAAHIRFTNYETPPEDYDSLGFYAIGTGAHTALSSLSHAVEHLGFSRWRPIEEILYHVMAAKFMAESATDVGKDTLVVVTGHKERIRFLNVFGSEDYIRSSWENHGAPRLPEGIGNAIQIMLCHSDEQNSLKILEKLAKYSPEAARRFEVLKGSSGSSIMGLLSPESEPKK